MHVPQSHETRAEMRELMMVPHNIVSPQARVCGGGRALAALGGFWGSEQGFRGVRKVGGGV